MTYRQDPPNTIKIEFTEGCNLRCQMCGIQGIREKPGGLYEYLTTGLAEKIGKLVAESGWNSKFEFSLRGEPLMNPNSAAIIGILRKHLPKACLMVTTNGIPLLRKPGVNANLDALFANGLNIFAMDCYEASKKAEAQIRLYEGVPVTDYPGGPSPYHKVKANVQRIILMEDFEKAAMQEIALGTKRVNSHCGAGLKPPSEPLQRRCARPFREMVIRWDGRVALCCNSWRDEYKCGHIDDFETIADAWNSIYLMAARRKLYRKDRDFGVCRICDERTFRDGLLPDRLGKKSLRKPNEADEEAILEAMIGGPATTPVLRPWEQK